MQMVANTMTLEPVETPAAAAEDNRLFEPGYYFITFPVGDKHYRRRVIVGPDAHGVLRCRWANPDWKLFPPLSADDIGLRVDQMDPSIRFERVLMELPAVDAGSPSAVDSAQQDVAAESTAEGDSVATCQLDEQSQAQRRSLLDSESQPLKPGRYYLRAANGALQSVTIAEDQLTFDLWIERDGKRQRVDELPESAVLIPHDGSWTD